MLSMAAQNILLRSSSRNKHVPEDSSNRPATRLLDLPEDLLLRVLLREDVGPIYIPRHSFLCGPWDGLVIRSRVRALFQTCRQLRNLVLQHHDCVIVNIPAGPLVTPRRSRHNANGERYWHHFRLGCQAMKRAVDTATAQNIANVGLMVQTIANDSLPDSPDFQNNKSWGNMQCKLITEGVGLLQLHILKLNGLQLSESFFLDLVQSMPSLHSLTLTKCQLETPKDLVHCINLPPAAASPLQHLEMADCCLTCNQQKQCKFHVVPKCFVSFRKLSSFVYVNDCATKDQDHFRCPWQWLVSAAKQITSLTVQHSQFKLQPNEVWRLSKLKQLICLKLDVSLSDDLLEVLLQMPNLEQVELQYLGPGLDSDFSGRVWSIKKLVINSPIGDCWVEIMSRLQLNGCNSVEVTSGYLIRISDEEVHRFLALTKRITWPANRGTYMVTGRRQSTSSANMLLPYIDVLEVDDLDLNSELANALEVEAQRRVITVYCGNCPPLFVGSILPVLYESDKTLILGPETAWTQPGSCLSVIAQYECNKRSRRVHPGRRHQAHHVLQAA